MDYCVECYAESIDVVGMVKMMIATLMILFLMRIGNVRGLQNSA